MIMKAGMPIRSVLYPLSGIPTIQGELTFILQGISPSHAVPRKSNPEPQPFGAMIMRKPLIVLAALLLPLSVQAQEMQWEDYEPTSTLVVPQNPVTKAKYPFIDAHAHQWRIGGASAEDVAALVAEMDKMNMAVMVNLSGGSGDDLVQKVQNTEMHAPGRFASHLNRGQQQRDQNPNDGDNN